MTPINTMEDKSLKSTPLLQEHKILGAKLAPFGGWLMPIQYSGIIAEHNWTRESASVFDICHMGEFIIYGDADKSNLNRIVTNSLDNMPCHSCHYGFMLNEEGGIVDDLVVYRIEQDKWMLVVNAATTDNDETHLKKYLSSGSKLENVSQGLGKLDLQGPLSKDVLAECIDPKIDSLKYYTFGFFRILGEENIISRTGYTGELGYELYISSQNLKDLWRLFLKDDRVKPAGLGARDILRLEMGYSLYGQDIDDDTTPQEANLEDFVDFSKDFIGRDALLKKQQKGIARRLIYFIAGSRRAPRHNYKIYADNKEVGVVTSGAFSPSLSCGIGIGYVENGYDKIGSKIILKGEKAEIAATITDKPFYKKGTAKS